LAVFVVIYLRFYDKSLLCCCASLTPQLCVEVERFIAFAVAAIFRALGLRVPKSAAVIDWDADGILICMFASAPTPRSQREQHWRNIPFFKWLTFCAARGSFGDGSKEGGRRRHFEARRAARLV
jgi:hypothetical protein